MESETGYRFHPTDEELVHYYLRRKMLGRDDEVNIIPEISILQHEPWEIPGKAMKMSDNPDDQVWYFFSAHSYKFTNSQQYSATFDSTAVRTNWIMHQYSLTFDFPTTRDFVICELKNKSDDLDDTAAIGLEQGQTSNQAQNQNYNASDCGYNQLQHDFDQNQAYMGFFGGYKEEDYSLNSVMQLSNGSHYHH